MLRKNFFIFPIRQTWCTKLKIPLIYFIFENNIRHDVMDDPGGGWTLPKGVEDARKPP